MAHVARMHGEQRFVFEIEQARHGASPTHAVPLVAHAPGEQADRQFGRRDFGGWLVFDRDKARLAIGRRETPVFVKTDLAGTGPFRIRPLLRPSGFEQGVGQAGDVEIAPTRTLAVFVEDGLGIGVREQSPGIGTAQLVAQTTREVDDDFPVVAGLTRCLER